ncbi:MAG TPA: PilZ domain-containing protein [Vicinamibacterales bacterium]|nr:PilZ domain-containing protein [Vicinamibacterales bacterium]
MPDSCIVAIAGADRLSQLKERIGAVDGELLAFTDAEALAALEAIVSRKPKMVAFERLFAASPRGAALINRIKADKKLTASEIKVFAHDSDVVRVVPRQDAAAAPALDQTGTRRAPRVRMAPRSAAIVDGKTSALVDLSAVGAQVVSPGMLKPNQPVTVVLTDSAATIRVNANVAWTAFETTPDGGSRYRAGVEFVDADAREIEAFCERHKAP